MTNIYTLNDINTIAINEFEFSIPSQIKDIINKITEQISAPTYNKTPVFSKGDSIMSNTYNKTNIQKTKYKNKHMSPINDVWRTPTLKATKIVRVEGIDLQINEIRLYLNKMTVKTYENMKENIIKTIYMVIDSYLKQNNDTDTYNNDDITELLNTNELAYADLHKIADHLFNTASSNAFYSLVYAQLYTELLEKYPYFNEIFQKCLSSYISTFTNIEYVNPDKDYNKYCEINAINLKRRAISLFFINLNKQGVLQNTDIADLLQKLVIDLLKLCKNDDNINVINEIVENIKILYAKDGEFIKGIDSSIDGKTILEIITQFSNENNKINPGVSNKTKFIFYSMIGK
jgi:hypothetical protein